MMSAGCHVENDHPSIRISKTGIVPAPYWWTVRKNSWFPMVRKVGMADIFSTLNNLNVALQWKTVAIFNVQDKINTRLEMELWCGRL